MPRGRLEQQLEAIERLKAGTATAEAEHGLQKALTNRNNYYVSKAAAAVETLGLKQLLPDLLTAYTRFFEQDDSQCWAKTALSKALAELGHEEPEPFLRGLTHIQMEPVYGGQVDTAGILRGNCAIALVGCRSLSSMDLLRHLSPVLLDPVKTVRIEATRAVVRIGREEGALLLRLRALQGDADAEVIAALFAAIIALERREGVQFVARFLAAGGETAEEAALSLGESRTGDALEILKHHLENLRQGDLRRAVITAIALTRLPDGTDFLLQMIHREAPGAAEARQALLACGALSEADRATLRTR